MITNYSRHGFLLAGAATGVSMTLATGESETADAAATSAKLGTTTNPFPGFAAETVKTSGTTIHVSMMWHHVDA
jgi:hypothetical protein